jgi:MFS family permease
MQQQASSAPFAGFQRDTPYAWSVAGLMALTYAVAFIDRQVLNLLVDPIKRDLLLSDTSISLLQGLAFVAAYVAMGPVFGRYADRGSRRNLLIIGVTLWCLFTVACGFAQDFWTLFIARAGVGAAEACLLPAGWSMLADYFSRERLPRAMSIFLLGPFVGGGFALIFGGLIVQGVAGMQFGGPLAGLEPWQLTFVFVGAPGLVLAVLLLLVREPPRHGAGAAVATGAAPAPDPGGANADRAFTTREVVDFLWQERAFYGRFFGGMALLVVMLYALPAWTPAFLMRAHGGNPRDVGLEYGTATLLAGSLGILMGPWIARRLARRWPQQSELRTTLIAGLCAAPACLYLPFAPSYWSALIASTIGSLCLNFALPMAASALQASTPNRMRGLVTSAYAFVLTSVGMGIAPSVIAIVTDRVLQDPMRVGVSLGWVCGISALLALPLLMGAARLYGARLEATKM